MQKQKKNELKIVTIDGRVTEIYGNFPADAEISVLPIVTAVPSDADEHKRQYALWDGYSKELNEFPFHEIHFDRIGKLIEKRNTK